MTTAFYSGSNWEQSSEPSTNVNVQSDDLYPHFVNVANKDVLANGLHPILAIGSQAAADGRGINQQCGVMVTYDADLLRAVMDIAQGKIIRQYVSNVLTYDGGAPSVPNSWDANLDIGQPVYVDDTPTAGLLADGVTLTLSPLNNAGVANAIAGVCFYDQDEDEDVAISGANADAWPKTADVAATVYTLISILLT